LRGHHQDYRHIILSTARIEALPIDSDVSASIPVINNPIDDPVPTVSLTDELPPPAVQSIVPNLNVTTTEVDLIREQLTDLLPLRNAHAPAPSIRQTPLDEASGNDRLFAMAFPTLYPTGAADFNCPRLRKVDLSDYARHLLCFHDNRFGRHPRWRFLIFNILMRRKSARTACFYVSKASGLKDMTREELTDALQADSHLVDQVVRQGSVLTGTRPFWRNKSNSLTAQARFLSTDTAPVFITFSAADMQWQDLHRHFPDWTTVKNGSETARRQFIWDKVQNYPHIVAHYLQIRFRTFISQVLQPLLKFTDYWDRFEWQARGSGHLHCLFWIPTAPSLDQNTDEARTAFACYWGKIITAWNPDQLRLPDLRHPSALAPTDVTNTSDQFTAFINRFQRHPDCSPGYCLRTNKVTDQSSCRFYFPRPLFTDPIVTKEINHKSWLFSPARNDPLLNQCAPVITLGMSVLLFNQSYGC
jgi:hypothetical protein